MTLVFDVTDMTEKGITHIHNAHCIPQVVVVAIVVAIVVVVNKQTLYRNISWSWSAFGTCQSQQSKRCMKTARSLQGLTIKRRQFTKSCDNDIKHFYK